MGRKLKIYSKKNVASSKEGQLYLRLMQRNNHDDINLHVVDSKGERVSFGCILSIDQDINCIVIQESFKADVGLRKDIFDKVVVLDSDEYNKLQSYQKSVLKRAEFEKKLTDNPEGLSGLEGFRDIMSSILR